MNTIKEKVQSAIEINELAINFGQHYFAEYVYLSKSRKIKNKENIKTYVDKEYVYIDNIDIINEYMFLRIMYITSGNSSIMENDTLRIKVSFETLEQYAKEPTKVIRELVEKDLNLEHKQSTQKEQIQICLNLKERLDQIYPQPCNIDSLIFPYLKKK